MAFEVFHFPYNRADHPSSWDLAFSIHEDMDVIQALCLNHLVSDLRFQNCSGQYLSKKEIGTPITPS